MVILVLSLCLPSVTTTISVFSFSRYLSIWRAPALSGGALGLRSSLRCAATSVVACELLVAACGVQLPNQVLNHVGVVGGGTVFPIKLTGRGG